MPMAAATWRTVFCTAEPAPDFSGGVAKVIRVVAGAITFPRPNPRKNQLTSSTQAGLSGCSSAIETNTRPASTSPKVITLRAPNRSTIFALRGAARSCPTATGNVNAPASSGL